MTTVNMESVKLMNSAKFSKEKTEELIQHIKEKGEISGIEDLSSYLRKSGLIVKESIGRKRVMFEMNPKFYGVNLSEKAETVQKFHKNRVKNSIIGFLPKESERKLTNLESSVRMLRRRSAIGYEDKFMTLETYEAFKSEFEKRKEEYFKLCDQIVANWDDLVKEFKEELSEWLQEFNAMDREVLFSAILSRIPTREAFKNSFYMNLTVKAFPVTENLEMFRDEIKEQIQEGLTDETVTTLYEIIGNTLNQAYASVLKVVTYKKENGTVPSRTKTSLKKTAEMIAQKNIFANPVINAVKADIMEMLRSGDIITAGEEILGGIYGYAKELKIQNYIDTSESHLDEEEQLMYYDDFKLKHEDSLKKEDEPTSQEAVGE